MGPSWVQNSPKVTHDGPRDFQVCSKMNRQKADKTLPCWRQLGESWSSLGAMLGGVFDTSEAILEPSWGRSRAPRNCHPKSTLNNATTRSSLAILEPAGGQLEFFLGYFGATLDQSWSHIMAILETAEAILEPSRSRKTIMMK